MNNPVPPAASPPANAPAAPSPPPRRDYSLGDRVRSRVIPLLRESQPRFPYVAVWEVTAREDVELPEPEKFAGLMYAQLIAASAGQTCVTVWESQTAFELHREIVGKRFGSGGAPARIVASGHQRGASLPKARWWTASKLIATVATIAALIGNFDSISDFAVRCFGNAVVDVRAVRPSIEVVRGDRFSAEFELQNSSRFATTRIEVTGVTGGTAGANELTLDPLVRARFPIVKPGESVLFRVDGRADTVGGHDVKVNCLAESGFFWPEREIGQQCKIEVWPDVEVTGLYLRETRDEGRVAVFTFEVRAGRRYDAGLQFEAVLNGVPDAWFYAAQIRGVRPWETPPPTTTPGLETAKISWSSNSEFGPFESVRGAVRLESANGKTDDEWEAVTSRIALERPRSL